MRFESLLPLFVLGLAGAGCWRPDALGPAADRGLPTAELRVVPLPGEPAPELVVCEDDRARWSSPPDQSPLPARPIEGSLRLSPIASGQRFHPLRLEAESRAGDGIAYLPVAAARRYRSHLDLLVELARPWTGTTMLGWPTAQLRVWPPTWPGEPDYARACLDAMRIWNEALGFERFVVADGEDDAQVVCTVAPEARLAYARVIAREDDGRPSVVRIHVSPRYESWALRYVTRTYVHEFAHALGLWGHSVDPAHILNGRSVRVDRPHAEEIRVARWLAALPRDFDLVPYGYPRARGPLPSEERFSECPGPTADGTAWFRRE